MPSTDRAAKRGIRTYLATTAGLGPADGVTIWSAYVDPGSWTAQTVVLGDVTAPQTQAGLATRARTATAACAVVVTVSGGDETAIDAAGARADELRALIEAALKADPSAAGTVTNPGRIVVATSGLEESPATWEGSAARRATVPFTLTWTTHIT